jgi:hypothetical protein
MLNFKESLINVHQPEKLCMSVILNWRKEKSCILFRIVNSNLDHFFRFATSTMNIFIDNDLISILKCKIIHNLDNFLFNQY